MNFHYKNYLSLLFIVLFSSLYGQKKKITEIYDLKTSFAETKAMYKADFFITKSLVFEDGSSISIGDTLRLGPSSSKISNTYETVATGRTTITYPISEYSRVNTSMREFNWVLETIKGSRFLGDLNIEMWIRNPEATGLAQKYLTINVNSFSSGEVVNPNRLMTRKEAIDKLKESKELLDLGIISQQDFDVIKKNLTPIIMGQ